MTMLCRDFPEQLEATGGIESMMKTMWNLSFKNLMYLLPFFVDRVLCPTDESAECEEQDITFKACICQII